jgi:ubiquinone/menaquinone biosynthesis C-methylase UbiE
MLDVKFWKKYFEVYDVLNELIPYQQLLERIIKQLSLEKTDLVLDAGSGTGNLAVLIEKTGARAVGIDFSSAGVAIHKKKIPNADVRIGDLTEPLPFPDNHFDKICSNNVIYTISCEKRPELFKEFYRVLKPGGVIVISNIHKTFSPFEIYKSHVHEEFKQNPLALSYRLIKFIVPTAKMFNYNKKIRSENSSGNYDFLDIHDQHKLLKNAGFSDVSEGEYVYAGQASLNRALK